jgi:serine/threonine protein kinase
LYSINLNYLILLYLKINFTKKYNMEKKPIIVNKVKNRILRLAPTVEEGLERECTKEDFFSEGDRPIGKGGFGQVWKVRHKATDKIYVIKVMNKQNIIDQKMGEQINREIDIMYKLNHPHIIKLVNHYEDDDNLYLIMHFASKGQLYSLLKRHGRFDQRTTAQYMREIISAVKYLHSFTPPIIHRDIKPENILLDENGRVKLADFGWSNYEDKKRQTYCGTPEYLAPEMIKKEGHDTTVDIWDLGVLMFEFLTGHPPFSGSNHTELFMNIKKHKINWPDDFPPLAKNLISKILKQNPKERIGLEEILQHAWFEKNPTLKPVLAETPMDDKAILESLLINVKADLVKDELNKLIQDKKQQRKSIIEQIKKGSANNLTSFTGNEVILNTQVNEDNVNNIKAELERVKKENGEFKHKSDKLEMEIKTLKNEIAKYKDNQNRTQVEIELAQVKDELDRYKIMNKDRLGLLTEIEEKNNEILDLRNKLLSSESEGESVRKALKQSQAKSCELLSQLDASDIKISDLKHQIDALHREKDDLSTNYQKKVEILQAKIIENTSTDNTHDFSKLLDIINESINDFKIIFKYKTDNLGKFLVEFKEEAEKCEKKFGEIINERHNSIIEVINRIKLSLEEDYIKIKIKLDKDNPTKMNERLEWLKKQISELMPYKIKSSNLEIQVSKLESQIKRLEEQLELYKTNSSVLEKVNNEKDYKISKNEKYITNLEARLSDVKDYLFRNHQDKLDEFKKWYKF